MLVANAAPAADLVVEHVTVLSPEQSQPLADRNVLIRDGRIVSIGQQAVAARGDTRTIDGRGKFLTPGIMDSHVHASDSAGIPPIGDDPQLVALRDAYQRQQPRSYLYFGVTQVLDLFGEGLKRFESQPVKPDLFHCGSAPVLDGYPTAMIPQAVRYQAFPEYIYEPANAQEHPLPADAKEADHTPEAVIERAALGGAHCFKIFIEDGFGPASNWPMPSKETLARVRAATRKHKMLLIAHANALDMQRIALDADVDVLAHGLWNWGEYDGQPDLPAPIAEHLRKIHAKNMGYQATLRVLPGTADMFREDTLKDPMYAKVVPPKVLAWYATEPGQWFKQIMREGAPPSADVKIMHGWLKQNEQGMRGARPSAARRQRYAVSADVWQSAWLRHVSGDAVDGAIGRAAARDFPRSDAQQRTSVRPRQGLRHRRDRQDREPAPADGEPAGDDAGVGADREGDPARGRHRAGDDGCG
jgi:hypothetical protein